MKTPVLKTERLVLRPFCEGGDGDVLPAGKTTPGCRIYVLAEP